MPNISVSVVDGNNITLVTTPTPTQVITIDRGIAGPAGPAGVPGGSNTQVQFNSASNFAGSANFTFDGINRITNANVSDGVAVGNGLSSLSGSLLIETRETAPTGCFMRPDGLALYVIGVTNDRIQYYSLSTAWDTSTATWVSQSIATTTQNANPNDLFFSADGLNVFIIGTGAPASIFKYTLTIPWDISTLTYSGTSLDISALSTGATGLFFSTNGLYMYSASNTGAPNDSIHYWRLSTAWLLSSANYAGYISISVQETSPVGVSLSNDGLTMWVVGSSGDDFNTYKLSYPWEISTAEFYSAQSFSSVTITSPTGFYVSPDGLYLYLIDDVVGSATLYRYISGAASLNQTGILSVNGDLSAYQNFSVAGNTSLWRASLSNGTVNGVTYLNDSKQITADSSLSFDGTKFEVASATGSLAPIATEVRISTTTNASDWSTTLPWARLGYYSADGSSFGPKLQASIDVISNAASGGLSNLTFNTADTASGALTERVRIEAGLNGFVGIGANEPAGKLHIRQDQNGTTREIIQNRNSTGTPISELAFITGSFDITDNRYAYIQSFGGGSSSLTFGTSNAAAPVERMRIDAVGNVLVGIATTPTVGTNVTKNLVVSSDISTGSLLLGVNGSYLGRNSIDGSTVLNTGQANIIFSRGVYNTATESMRIDNAGNMAMSTGVFLPYVPAPAATISAVTTLTNAQILPQIVVTSGTTFTLTMPLGTTLETLITWPKINIGFDFTVINTASGTITMAVNTGVTAVGTLTVLTGISAKFRLRRTAANTFVMYRV